MAGGAAARGRFAPGGQPVAADPRVHGEVLFEWTAPKRGQAAEHASTDALCAEGEDAESRAWRDRQGHQGRRDPSSNDVDGDQADDTFVAMRELERRCVMVDVSQELLLAVHGVRDHSGSGERHALLAAITGDVARAHLSAPKHVVATFVNDGEPPYWRRLERRRKREGRAGAAAHGADGCYDCLDLWWEGDGTGGEPPPARLAVLAPGEHESFRTYPDHRWTMRAHIGGMLPDDVVSDGARGLLLRAWEWDPDSAEAAAELEAAKDPDGGEDDDQVVVFLVGSKRRSDQDPLRG